MEVNRDISVFASSFEDKMAGLIEAYRRSTDAANDFRRAFYESWKLIAADVLRDPPPKWRRKRSMYRSLHRTINRRLEWELS